VGGGGIQALPATTTHVPGTNGCTACHSSHGRDCRLPRDASAHRRGESDLLTECERAAGRGGAGRGWVRVPVTADGANLLPFIHAPA
jgi:hypothetical protein